jgi:diacylglycerol kinase family enzyme
LFDYLHVGAISRWEVIRYMPRLASGKSLPRDHTQIWMGRCREMRLRCDEPLTIHVDGEFFSKSEDNVREIVVTLLPQALTVVELGE